MSRYTRHKDNLLALIRNGKPLTRGEQVLLTILMSVPAMMAQLSHIIMQCIDSAMVGSLGDNASASIGLVSTTIWLFSSLNSAANVGFCVQVAHKIGAGSMEEARNILRQSLPTCIAFSLFLAMVGSGISFCLPHWLGGSQEICHDSSLYFLVFSLCLPFSGLNSLCCTMLRCSGNVHVPSILNIAMCVLDVVFNWFLIFPSHTSFGITIPGAGLGVVGAVIGTAMSFVVISLVVLYFTTVRSRELCLTSEKGSFLPRMATLRESARISLPIAVQHVVLCGAQIVTTIIVAPLGTIALAANTFGITVESLCYMPGYGIADAGTAIVGQGLGAGRRRLAKSLACMAICLGIAVMTVMGGLMYAFAPDLMSVMTPVVEVQQLATLVLRVEAFAEPMFAASIVCYGVFVGAGDTFMPCTMNLVSIWFVRVTLAVAMATTMGLYGVWLAMAIELTFRGIVFLMRFRSCKWMHKFQKKQ